jgi:hypothetical protein
VAVALALALAVAVAGCGGSRSGATVRFRRPLIERDHNLPTSGPVQHNVNVKNVY